MQDQMQNQSDDQWLNLFIDSRTGAASEETEAQLAAWRKASADNECRYVEMKKIWDSLSLSARNEQFDAQQAYLLFKARVENEAGRRTEKRRLSLRRVAAVAAILIPFLFLSYFSYRYLTLRPAATEEVTLLSEITVPNGSKTRMQLQDGSVVWLNAGSRMQYDSGFGKTNRTCTLTGEAYLEVEKNAELPFVIKTGQVMVKVLGTRFNVQAYGEDPSVKIHLLEGSVEMNAENMAPVRLQPGQMVDYLKATGKTTISHFEADRATDWMNNRFVFEGETFEQIAAILERSFNVKITILSDRVKNSRFAGDFIKNENLTQIFNIMAANGKFRYRMKGSMIEVY
jgi:ferric-dicitrate binding protein FerR (iron transport regulator)